MQNLRDKLLKAGKINQKQKRSADQQARGQRKTRKGHNLAAEAEAKRKAAYDKKLAEARARDQKLEAARKEARRAREQHLRAQHLVGYYGERPRSGGRRWYFMARNHKIRYLELSSDAAQALTRGQLAIVERIGARELDDDYVVVPAGVAEHLWEIDDGYVRFYNRVATDKPPRWWETMTPDDDDGSRTPPMSA